MANESDEGSQVRDELDAIEEKVMDGLMEFQKATVEEVDALYRKGYRRVLVADEVGLGKTLVARGVIAKFAKLRREQGDPFVKVAYICSNGSIAQQNLHKLMIDPKIDLASSADSRLSMQHLQYANELSSRELRNRYIQLIPLTPATSFSPSRGQGNQRERALMFAVLERDPEIQGTRKGRLKKLLWAGRQNGIKGNWNLVLAEQERELDKVRRKLARIGNDEQEGTYPENVIEKVKAELSDSGFPFEKLLDYLDRYHARGQDKEESNRIISLLRDAFVKASMDFMDLDLVIMDEFQRFRSLVANDGSEMSALANRIFARDVRVLLLSATPFRLYSTEEELNDETFDSSNQEFGKLVEFLADNDQKRVEDFEEAWSDYSHSLVLLDPRDNQSAYLCMEKKVQAQQSAGQFIARTERASTKELAPGVKESPTPLRLDISKEDISSYLSLAKMSQAAGTGLQLLRIDYSKSCPYLMSFMRGYGYKFKRELVDGARNNWPQVEKACRKSRDLLWIDPKKINSYQKLNVQHARYKQLSLDTLGTDDSKDAWRSQLLWVPPSMPYYKPSRTSPYAKAKGFSKTLVFSSWAFVPPALSSLLSYEAEQRNVTLLRKANEIEYQYRRDETEGEENSEADIYSLPNSRLSMSGRRANSFCLVYPSPYLAQLFDPSQIEDGRSLNEIRREIARRIRKDLEEVLPASKSGRGRSRAANEWYAIAEILLDERYLGRHSSDLPFAALLSKKEMADKYSGSRAALANIQSLLNNPASLDGLGRIPSDLETVLTDAAIGSPAVCASRAYGIHEPAVDPFLPFEFGYAFMSRMNTTVATVCVAVCTERGKTSSDAHWKHVLAYCCEGNFQAVMDEYVHMVYEGNILSAHRQIVGMTRSENGLPSLNNTDSHVEVDTFGHFSATVQNHKRGPGLKPLIMRTNYASGFMETRDAVEKGENRRSSLRDAFNSPFWPFVLISTSIGQEGLDFHQYCRRVVHWNLPTNPIDFEQREGRINRYKCLAVRQSLAERYSSAVWDKRDKWGELFKTADREENEKSSVPLPSGLLPYWGVTEEGKRVPIERLVYGYPFSRDDSLYSYLLLTMARYRAVLGQPDQEELLNLLAKKYGDEDVFGKDFSKLFLNLCPFCRELER